MQNNNFVGWKRRWTFVLAATGSAVGLGNIWKFPYIAGEYGGGAFVMVYLACILLVGVPVMMAEILIGKRGRTDPIHSVIRAAQDAKTSSKWSIVGILGVAAGLMILMFYSVVAGWSLDYVYQSIAGSYGGLNPQEIKSNFEVLVGDFNRQMIWHSLFVVLTVGVVAIGVTKGIGTTVEILMPMLVVLLLVLLGYSWAEGDFRQAAEFMFTFDLSKLSREGFLVALGHSFFTLSLGMGAIMAYGAYMPEEASVAKSTLTIAFLDTIIALIAGMVIFPLVFANGMQPGEGPGLMFQTLPIIFSIMPAGMIFGALFFILVAIAALSSSISLIEPGVAWLERQGVKRAWSAVILGLVAWLGGVGSIYSSDVFNFFDFTTANIMLPLGGLLIAIFVGWIMRRNSVRKVHADLGEGMFNTWYICIRFIAPLGVATVLVYSLAPSIKALLGMS